MYMSFANFFGVQGLHLLEEYYEMRANEEYLHHSWIRKYMNDNDIFFVYPEIPAVEVDYKDNIVPFQLTVDVEIQTTELIYEMIDLAAKEGDWLTFNWLNGNSEEEGRLCREQSEEMSISRTALDIAMDSEASWLRKEQTIMDAYKKSN